MPRLQIEVVYALADAQDIVTVELGPGARARDAIEASGMQERHPELDAASLLLCIFGKRVGPERVLEAGDRIEILRPLAADPKDARRRRAGRSRRR